MQQEEHQWLIDIIKDRFQNMYGLELTDEQAERIHQFEDDKNVYSATDFFSEWEEWDFEWASFKDILTEQQFETYEEKRKGFIQQMETGLKEADRARAVEIDYHQELIGYYENEFLPDFFNDRFLQPLAILPETKTKVDFLKAEYRRYLIEYRKHVLVGHFRYARTFRPNLLRISLLQLKLNHLWPDYFYFKRKMDESTKAVAEYLEKKVDYLDDRTYEFVRKKFDALTVFNQKNEANYFSDWTGFRFTIGEMPPEELRICRLMGLVLLDKARYDWRE
ncbi:hypothetical protein ACFPMF_00625 [Larkinella bovis]|uniref:Uncharacterized protein n=1 Tax=Larkinella bovis TaxID=683041 RepID=A0ABW0I5J5_9BACT